MAEIRVLDKHTAELIAAGEVVEQARLRGEGAAGKCHRRRRDADHAVGSEPGGIQQLQIVDNGSGIEAEYI